MKRFWSNAEVAKTDDGWQVLLDGRPVRTPAKRACVVPVQAMADLIAVEWRTQEDIVDPLSMPLTRAASTCLDRVAPEMSAVGENIAGYGETDLLCYRATHPNALIDRQTVAWDPWLAWATEELDAPLKQGAGVMHIAQPEASLFNLAQAVKRCGPWTLTGLSELVTISGSLVLGLAVQQGAIAAQDAWPLSRIDEDWNIEKWGDDEDAAALAARRQADFLNAARVLSLLPETKT